MPSVDFFQRFGFLVMRQFLDPASCSTLAAEMRGSELVPTTVRVNGESTLDESVRNSEWATVSETTASVLHDRLLALKPMVESHFNMELAGLQKLQFLAYREGAFFAPHRDGQADGPPLFQERKVGVVIFVNGEADDGGDGSYSGGSLTFFDLLPEEPWDRVGFPLQGERGLLVAFPAHLMHEVRRITRGQRFTIATFYR